MKVIPSDKVQLQGRYVIVDDDGKLVDDAQGYGYKSSHSANQILRYNYSDRHKNRNKNLFIQQYPGLINFITFLYARHSIKVLNGEYGDKEVLAAIKKEYGVDMPPEYLKP